MKKYMIIVLAILIIFTTGCGKIPNELREDERNYKEMLKEAWLRNYEKELIIKKDQALRGEFIYEFASNSVTEHQIEAYLKDDPSFIFNICTGFSEEATFSVRYGYKTNYEELLEHQDLLQRISKCQHIILKSKVEPKKYYSKCEMPLYSESLVFDEKSSFEDIAIDLANLKDLDYRNMKFSYGANNCFIDIVANKTASEYEKDLNDAFCY